MEHLNTRRQAHRLKACPHERSLIAGQAMLPDDNGSFDDVGSVNNKGSCLVTNNATS